MSFERILLGFLTAFVLVAAIGCLLAPSLFAQQAEIVATPSALTEIRAFYGGLQLGIGFYLVWCLRSRARTAQGLVLVGLAVGAAGVARAFGVVIDGAPTAHHLANLGIEAATVALVAIALTRMRR